MGYIDMHMHSIASDGKWSPKQIVDFCINNNVTTISLTEHYNLGSYKIARKLAENDVEIIPGIEIGATLNDLGYSKNHVCHLLAYYPNYNICKILDQYELSREKCVKRTLEVLREKKHMKISYRDVLRVARSKKSVGRFDIAIAIARLGYSLDPITAYGEYLDCGKVCYIDRQKMPTSELINEIRKVQGVPVIAHPKSLKMLYNELFDFLKTLKGFGLEGLEVYNPHHTEEQTKIFSDMADELGLIKTVGSDFHGKSTDNIVIGYGIENNLMIDDYSIITNLKKCHSKILLK
ncbi:MAG: PHP domain-containing protein [Clostridia bacterium]|nr:PHP domain-containing protein [Clostridia bacterium]